MTRKFLVGVPAPTGNAEPATKLYVDTKPRGAVAYGKVTTSTTAANPCPAMRIDGIQLYAGRQYRIYTNWINIFGTAGDTDSLNIRYTTNNTQATAASAELPGARHEMKLVNGGGAAAQFRPDTVYVPAADQIVSLLLIGERNTGSGTVQVYGDATSIVTLTVEDIGAAPTNTAVDL